MLEVTGLHKDYPTPRGTLSILSDISLSLKRGDAISIMGPSGSGKSTLLYILGAMEPPTSGTIKIDGRNPYELRENELAAFRNNKIGFVFQDHFLLPQCSVLENVLIPTLVSKPSPDNAIRARKLIERMGLSERMDHRPAELSGGEKQRVALARALIKQPLLLLCDEPTGNLDHASAESVGALLLDLQKDQQTILVVVTHNTELATKFPRSYQLTDKRLVLT